MTGGTPTQVDGDPEMMRGIPTKTDETKGPKKDGKAQEDGGLKKMSGPKTTSEPKTMSVGRGVEVRKSAQRGT